MPFDEDVAERVRRHLATLDGIEEKRMFGGLAFMLHGNMCVGVNKDELMVRVGPDAYEKALALKHARPMDFTGKPLKGYVFVGPQGFARDSALQSWIARGVAFTATLKPK